jgi:hypothetical protein
MKPASIESLPLTVLIVLLSLSAPADVVSDGSRGSVVCHAGVDFGITGGKKVGGSLFYSFSELNLLSANPPPSSAPTMSPISSPASPAAAPPASTARSARPFPARIWF